MKICITCGMPMIKKEDFGLQNENSLTCFYCTSEDGNIKSCEEIFEGGVNFFMSVIGNKKLAKKITRKNMNSLPYWQGKKNKCLRGEIATDEEFNETLQKINEEKEILNFTNELKEKFPDFDKYIKKMIDFEIEYENTLVMFNNFTIEFIENRNESIVKNHLEYMSGKLLSATKFQEEYINHYISYIFFVINNDNEKKKWVFNLLPENIKNIYIILENEEKETLNFINEIKEKFPDADEYIKEKMISLGFEPEDKMYASIFDAFSQFTTDFIKSKNESIVKNHLEYISSKLLSATKIQEEYINLYIESLMWDINDNEIKKWGFNLFSENIKNTYLEIWGNKDWLLT